MQNHLQPQNPLQKGFIFAQAEGKTSSMHTDHRPSGGKEVKNTTAKLKLFDSRSLLQQQSDLILQMHIFLWGTKIQGVFSSFLGSWEGHQASSSAETA